MTAYQIGSGVIGSFQAGFHRVPGGSEAVGIPPGLLLLFSFFLVGVSGGLQSAMDFAEVWKVEERLDQAQGISTSARFTWASLCHLRSTTSRHRLSTLPEEQSEKNTASDVRTSEVVSTRALTPQTRLASLNGGLEFGP